MNPFKKNGKSISIFITAGYPEKDSLIGQILFLQEQLIDFIEIGIPFSDPMADGPVIQETSATALKNGMDLHLLFEQLSEAKEQIRIPLVIMSYFNPILQFGTTLFLQKCEEVGISGLIIPDLSFELVRQKYGTSFGASPIPMVYLVTPATSNERIAEIAQASTNAFVYLVGQNKITGLSYDVSAHAKRYEELKRICGDVPLFLGFGINGAQQKREAFRFTDGVIVGTAYLKALAQKQEAAFIKELCSE